MNLIQKSECAFVPICGQLRVKAFGTQSLQVMRVDVVTLDHAIESLAIDRQHARRGLFVAVGMLKDTRNVTSFDYR